MTCPPADSTVSPRVLLSIRHFYPDGGGAEVAALRLAKGLVRRGLSLAVLTGRYGKRPRTENMDGVMIHRHFIGVYVPVLHELCYLASLALKLILRRHEYDIVHLFQTQLSAFVTLLVTKPMGKKVIISSRGAGKSGDMAVWSSLPGGRQLLRFIVSHADAAVGVSRDVVAELHKAGFDPDRTWYLPNGVPVPSLDENERSAHRLRLGFALNDFVAVFVGRLSSEKAPELLLSAWPSVVKRFPSVRLVFVGDGRMRRCLETMVKKHALCDGVMFAGKVDNVPDYLNLADVFILPSISEGMSVALLEAMAARLPVIASRVSGTVDIIRHGENGLLFESGDREGLAQCLHVLIARPECRGQLGREARRTVEEQFNLDAAVERYLELYKFLGSATGKA